MQAGFAIPSHFSQMQTNSTVAILVLIPAQLTKKFEGYVDCLYSMNACVGVKVRHMCDKVILHRFTTPSHIHQHSKQQYSCEKEENT